jgi:cytochrome d ubiquinol oxidase subunit I
VVIAGIGVVASGHHQGQLMYEQQPMKMASAEAVCDGGESVPLSILAIGDLSNDCENARHLIELPGVTSFMGTNHFVGEESYLPGVNDVQELYEQLYGEGYDYRPNLLVTYWSFRLMIGLGMVSGLLALWGLWALRRGRITSSTWFSRMCLVALPMPFLASSFGWIFTEMGRQPWVVAPNPDNPVDQVWLRTADGVSTVITEWTVIASLVAFTLLYAALGVVWYWLVRRYVREGIDEKTVEKEPDVDQPLTFAY